MAVIDPDPDQEAGRGPAPAMQIGGAQFVASGAVTAYEPPWLVGYRMLAGGRTASIRVTCIAQPGGTRIHVRQPYGAPPLTVDLARPTRALDSSRPATGKDSHA